MPYSDSTSGTKPSSPLIVIEDATRRVRHGQHQLSNTTVPTTSSPRSLYLVDDVHHSQQEVSSNSASTLRPVSRPISLPGCRRPQTTIGQVNYDTLTTSTEYGQLPNVKKRFPLMKKLNEDITRGDFKQRKENPSCIVSNGITKHPRLNRSHRRFKGASCERHSSCEYHSSCESAMVPGPGFSRYVPQICISIRIFFPFLRKSPQIYFTKKLSLIKIRVWCNVI